MAPENAEFTRRVYLDVCALSRPFDDQQHARIRLETSAVDLILFHVRQAEIELIASAVHDVEIGADPDVGRRRNLLKLLQEYGLRPTVDPHTARERVKELQTQGLGVADAAHLAVAEQAQAEFVTVDDRLAKRYNRFKPLIWCGTPIAFCDKENLR